MLSINYKLKNKHITFQIQFVKEVMMYINIIITSNGL